MLQNLVENAWKFTSHRADALIEFGTTPTGNAPVCCYVRDNGAGFHPLFVSKLFQPFQRLHSTGEFSGTGIGLISSFFMNYGLGRVPCVEAPAAPGTVPAGRPGGGAGRGGTGAGGR